nr:hypothetical protein [Burkholderia stabilis]
MRDSLRSKMKKVCRASRRQYQSSMQNYLHPEMKKMRRTSNWQDWSSKTRYRMSRYSNCLPIQA